MISPRNIHLLLKACSTQQRAAMVAMSFCKFHFQSVAAPEGELRSSKNTGWSLLLLPTPSQDISSDGSSWRKGLCRVQVNWHQWVLPILLKPFLFGAMLGCPLTRILQPTAFTPPQAHYTKLQVCKPRTLANKRGNFGNQFRLPESAQVK